MKHIFFIACGAIILLSHAAAQTLPVKEYAVSANIMKAPFVFYISGDGGFNSFSNELCNTISTAGFGITAMNAKSYFDDKKTPEETVNAIVEYLAKQFANRPDQQLVLAGYSFGSDVMPFIVNRLPAVYKSKLISVVMVAPSTSTDFETHWSDMFGSNKKRSMDVVAELNSMSAPTIVTIFGSDESDFPVARIKIKNYRNVSLPGGHHFDGNTSEVAKTMMKYFK
jgi:type IV secretory pathway VirJ component